jgi:hypothetical protein
MQASLPKFAHAGARALVLLHERELRRCVVTWERALEEGIALPATTDKDYASLETLGVHVLGCARHYLVWCCEMLALPDPGIDVAPTPDRVRAECEDYLEHVLDRWRSPLSGVAPERFEERDHVSRWGRQYSIDAMLEHAVMHPVRHELQLAELLEA